MFEQPRPSSLPSLFSRRLKGRRAGSRRRRGNAEHAGLERLEGRRVMALDFVAAFPNFGQFITEGATLREAPQQITIRFSPGARIDPATLGAISIVRAGADGAFGSGDDVNVTPVGFVGTVAVDDFPSENQVVIRFAENLPDDLYRLSITGGLRTLANLPAVPAESFRNGGRLDLNFRLDLGAQVVSVVPQPITRQPNGSLVQARDTVVVHFNENDPLLEASAETVGNYRLYEIDPVSGDDIAVRIPQAVNYEAAVVGGRRISRATLTFGSDLGDKLYRLQIGRADDDNNTLLKAAVVGTLFQQPNATTPAFSADSFLGDGLDGRNDVDLYKIALTAGATLTVRVTPDSALNAALRIFDASGTQVRVLPSSGPGTSATLTYTAPSAGTFYVGVSSEGNAAYLPVLGTGATGGTTRGAYRLALFADAPPSASDANSSFGTATSLGVLGAGGKALNARINVRPQVPTPLGNLLFPTQPGTVDEPGHREIPLSVETHGMPGAALLQAAAAGIVPYNFQTNYGVDGQGNQLVNLITEAQKQRAREIFEILGAASGIRFVETATSGLTVATGDIRAVDPNAPVPNGPAGIEGNGLVVMNGSLDWGQSQFGGSWYSVAMHEILHALDVGHSYDIPSIMGDDDPAEGVIPGDYDLIHLNVLHPKNGSDVDTYSFALEADGKVSLETVVSRPGQPVVSLVDTVLTLYREDPATGARTLVARNDDFYGRDSFIGIDLEARNPGGSPYTYFVTVTSTGTTFDPNVENSGNGGRSDGVYQLKLGFVPVAAVLNTVVDTTNTPIDGDRDGRVGGAFNFWFQSSTAANTVYVDKVAPTPVGGPADGSLARPFTTVEAGLAAAGAGKKVVRIVGNSPGATATPYLIGTTLGGDPLADGADFVVPENVTVMIDEGAVFKLRAQVIDVGSASTLVSRRGAALQVLGTPGNQVLFTSYHDDTIGGDRDGVGPAVGGGQWGGIVMRADSDSASKKVFLNTISQADFRYGGGRVMVNGQDRSFAPIHLETSRPSLVFNTVRFSAGAALSADPNSFEETEYRRGPVVRGNRLVDNSINGMFVRVRTDFGQPIDTLDVPAVFASRDVTYVLTENLLISGGAGGYETRRLQATGTLTQNSDWIDVTDVSGLAPFMGVSGLGIPANALIVDIDVANNRIQLNLPATQSGVGVALTIDTGIAYARAAGRLQIDPGVVVKLQGSRIELGRGNAQLFAEGDPQNRVIFTSASDNRFGAGGTFDVFGTQVSQPAAGDWGGIVVNATAQASIDNAYIAFGGGQTSIEGGFDRFNVIEVHQGRLRLANSRLENNANGQAGSSRAGRGTNASATVFARGSQPVIVGNDFRSNEGAVVSINVNALSDLQVPDPGRSTGAIARYAQYDDNSGPLVRANTLAAGTSGAIGGMVVRGGEVTVEGVWDDTDIVHVVTSEIVVDNFHTATGLRLMSSPNASLVVKFSGPSAGLTATGHGTDIDDRIGGTVQVLGQPGYQVVLTSLADDLVGASLDPRGVMVKDTNGNGPSTGTAGDWRGLRFLPYSNDRNVAVARESEKSYTGGVDANRLPTTAQYLGVLAPNEKGGDDNRRLGFEVHGFISGDDTTDVDVYSFDGYAGSEVWIDIDKTSAAVDTMIELLDGSGRVLARSVDGQTDWQLSAGVRGSGLNLQKNAALGLDFYSQNPRDPGMRVFLPGTVLVPAQTTQYFVRVRSQPRVAATATQAEFEAAVSDAARVRQGATNGRYELRVRLQQRDEKPGSTVRYADIRFPAVGIDVQGLPRSSPLLGENGEAGANETLATAQYLGNLLATDRNTISVAGALSSAADVDWYAVDLSYEDIQVIGGLSNNPKTWSTVFDIDYADGIRGDLTLSVFNAQGQLMFVGRDSDLTQGGAPDRPTPGQGSGLDDLSKGSAGALDPFIGPAQLPTGLPGGTQRYYVAVSSNEQLPSMLDGTFRNTATNSFVRLEPINSVFRVVEDHIGFTGYNSGNNFTGSDAADYNHVAPYTGPVFSLPNLAQQVSGVSIDGLKYYLSEEPPPGTKAVATRAGDLTMRSDGWLYRYVAVTGAPDNANTVGELSRSSIVGGSTVTVIGRDNIPDSPPLQTLQEQNLAPTNTDVVVLSTTFSLSPTNVSARTPLIRETLTGIVQYSATLVPGQAAVTGSWSFTTAANGVVTFTPVGSVDPLLQRPVSGTATVQGLITITWSANVTITRTGILANPTLATVSYQTVPDPNAVTTDRLDAMAWRRASSDQTAFDRLFYSVRDIGLTGVETGVSRLYRAREATGDATFGAAVPGPNYGRVGTVIQTAGNDLGLTTGMAFIGQTLYGVDDRGHLFTIDQSTGTATLIGDVGPGGLNLQGLTVGPQNMAGGPDGVAGFFADKLFAVDRNGWMYCFDTSGSLLTEFEGRTTDRRYVGRVDNSGNQINGFFTGLAFSPVDINLWRATNVRGSEAGHGVMPTLDNTRDGGFTNDNRLQPPESRGDVSIYYGFDTSGDKAIDGTNIGHLGVASKTWARDLASNIGTSIARVPAPLSVSFVQTTTVNGSAFVDVVSPNGTRDLRVGMTVTGPGIAGPSETDPGPATIVAIIDSVTILLSRPATADGPNGTGPLLRCEGDGLSITTQPFSLQGYEYGDKPTLYFNYRIDAAAGLRVWLSTDGGQNWTTIAAMSGTRSTIDTASAILPAFASVSSRIGSQPNQFVQELFRGAGWRQARIDIGEFHGASDIRMRFDVAAGGEGVYIDDIIVGFAERGEIVTGAPANATEFFTIGTPVSQTTPQQNLQGAYQLEIRRGTEVGRLQDDRRFRGVKLDPGSIIDTHAGLVRGIANTNASSVNQGSEFRGDDNVPRQQGQFIIESNSIVSASTFGIRIDAAAREAGTNAPAPGVVRNLPVLNANRLVPGVVVVNNIVSQSGQAGILFSGDPNTGAGALAAVPFGRIVNNTIYGGATAQGVGIDVRENAGPTLLNNLFANLATGVNVDVTSAPVTVVGTSAFHNVGAQVTGVASDRPLVLTANPFVNAAAGNFYPVAQTPLIDSSLDVLQERSDYAAVIAPLGIPVSPIITPARDLFGQLRADDPSQPNAPGLGGNVFKDRGAVERVDFAQPSASLAVPLDNGPDDDAGGQANVVRLKGDSAAGVTQFVLQLNDVGVGIDKTTVRSEAFTLRRNGVTLVENVDYVFRYLETSNRVVFEAAAVFGLGTYELAVNRESVGGSMVNMIADLAGNRLLPNNGDGTTSFSIALVDVPNVPTGLVGVPGNGQVALSWNTPSGDTPLDRYEVQQSTNATFADATTINVTPPTVSRVVSSLVNGTQYWFRVRAVNAFGESDWSNVVGPVVPAAPPTLALGTGIANGATAAEATQVSGVVTVSGASGAAITVTFQRGTGTQVTKILTGTGSSQAVVLTAPEVTTLGDGVIDVSATQAIIPGSTSPAATTSFKLDTVAPPAPTLALGTGVDNGASAVEATQASGVVTVRGQNGAAITVTFRRGTGTPVTKTLTGIASPQAVVLTSADLTTLGNGVITVSATQVDAAGNPQTAPAATESFTLETVAPGVPAPTRLTARAGNGAVNLVWTAPTVPAGTVILDYVIQYSTDGGQRWTKTPDAVSTATRATVAVPVNGVSYIFRVAAQTAAGTGLPSTASASVTPFSPTALPGVPTTLTAARMTPGSVRLTWAAPPANAGGPVNGYVIQYRLATSTTWTSVTVNSTTPSATVSRLTAGRLYVFRVAARNLAGVGAFSSERQATP